MSKKLGIITLIVAIIAIILSAISFVGNGRSASGQNAEDQDIQYVLYLGTNDKDTNDPVFTPEKAEERAKEILIEHVGGYTIQEANGGWVDECKIYQEYTLVIYLSDTDLDHVHKACDDLIREFNQSSILIQANKTTTEFYAGKS